MSNIVPIKEEKDWKYYAARIATAWQKATASIIETGQCLIEAKGELHHGSFEAMVQHELPFNARTAQRLMAIARNPVLAKATHVSLLPPSWGTLYELTKLPEATLRDKIADHTINPKMQRKDVEVLLPKHPKRKQKDKYYRKATLASTDTDEDIAKRIIEVIGAVRCIAVRKLLKEMIDAATIGTIKLKS